MKRTYMTVLFSALLLLFLPLHAEDGVDTLSVGTEGEAAEFVIPATEQGRKDVLLEQFINEADEAALQAIVEKFKISTDGTLRGMREELKKYLGLIRVIRDTREPSKIVVKDIFKSPKPTTKADGWMSIGWLSVSTISSCTLDAAKIVGIAKKKL